VSLGEPRAAKNHVLFREVNERIYSLSEGFRSQPEDDGLGLALVCECGNGNCAVQVVVDTEKYSRIRQTSTHFLVADGHELAGERERVVERSPRYVVVERVEARA
jgi:hypothetical protein